MQQTPQILEALPDVIIAVWFTFLLERQKEAVLESWKQATTRKPKTHVRQCKCAHWKNELRITKKGKRSSASPKVKLRWWWGAWRISN